MDIKVHMKWRGAGGAEINAARMTALAGVGGELAQLSRAQAPVETDALRESVRVESKNEGVEVGYGLPYALMQHERLDFRHPRGGKAKFLEDPFNEHAARFQNEIAAALVRAAVKG